MKVTEVLAKVYEPGRLQAAWQQVKRNAGAAGIDRVTVAEFAQREETLLELIHDKLKLGSYHFRPATSMTRCPLLGAGPCDYEVSFTIDV